MSALPAGYPTNQTEAFALLATRKKLSIDDLKILALLEAAGESFYLAAAAALDNAEAKALLTRNGQEERGHAHRLLKAIALLGGEPFELPADEHNPYIRPLRLDGKISADVLATIEKGEQEGDLSYQAWADAESNIEVAKILRQNGSEETRHGERVAQVINLLK
jgi:rubrerythrin